jgi:hypothetical protein
MNRTQMLKEIIQETLGVDVMRKSRKRNVVDARKIYSSILHSKGFGPTFIGNSLLKNHATILHYIKETQILILMDQEYRNNHERISDAYERRMADGTINLLSRTELEEEINRLRVENHELKLNYLNSVRRRK